MAAANDSMAAIVDTVMTSRRAVRGFLPDAIPMDTIRAILEAARWAPSGSNTQPWKVYVLQGNARERLISQLMQVFDDPSLSAAETEAYPYYPRTWKSPFQERRRKVGWDLYGLLGLGREDKRGMHAQLGRNFRFFDAPVALLFTIDRTMELGSWLDYGMFLQNIMLAAQARGISTCPQAAFTRFHRIIAHSLSLPADERFVCGMSMGYADMRCVENTLTTEREPLENFVVFRDR